MHRQVYDLHPSYEVHMTTTIPLCHGNKPCTLESLVKMTRLAVMSTFVLRSIWQMASPGVKYQLHPDPMMTRAMVHLTGRIPSISSEVRFFQGWSAVAWRSSCISSLPRSSAWGFHDRRGRRQLHWTMAHVRLHLHKVDMDEGITKNSHWSGLKPTGVLGV